MRRHPAWIVAAAGCTLLVLWPSAGSALPSAGTARATAAAATGATTAPAAPPAPAASAPAPTARNTCFECHSQQEEERLVAPTRHFAEDIHAVRGLGCVACHGGNSSDPDISAMDPDKGYKGKPARSEIAEVCASCHANAAYMKRFNPKPYVFSMAEFRTSVHCKKIAEGDPKVATCTNCHGVHGILPRKDPRSPVYHRNVPFTCAKCHNAEYMAGRTVPTNQFALFSQSVHGKALFEKDDMAAPACNDCHGNHGAVPPNTRDISLVCGNCHGREGELFAKSRVSAAFLLQGRRGCVTCHSNHGVQHPTDATLQRYLSTPPGVPVEGRRVFLHFCSACHGPYGKGDGPFAETLRKQHNIRPRDLTDSTYIGRKTDEDLFAIISLGGGHMGKSTYMPAWTVSLSPEQIKNVASYVRVISKTPPQP